MDWIEGSLLYFSTLLKPAGAISVFLLSIYGSIPYGSFEMLLVNFLYLVCGSCKHLFILRL